jgi:hypothetical protein
MTLLSRAFFSRRCSVRSTHNCHIPQGCASVPVLFVTNCCFGLNLQPPACSLPRFTARVFSELLLSVFIIVAYRTLTLFLFLYILLFALFLFLLRVYSFFLSLILYLPLIFHLGTFLSPFFISFSSPSFLLSPPHFLLYFFL